MFENIIGYEYVKKELELIISWYKNEEFLNNENAKLPGGIIFYGPPGNGKTFFVKELINQFKDNSFILNGDANNVLNEISKTYKKARNNKISLVLIDEIDLLLDMSSKVARILQDELDGINKTNERVLTIATTNNLHDIPEALLRTGRFDRTIKIGYPKLEDKKKIFEFYLDKLNIKREFKNIDNVMNLLGSKSCSDIMSICNDCYFRFNNEIVKEENIMESISKLDSINSNFSVHKTKDIAYHEVGHYLMGKKYSNYFNVYEVKFTDTGGVCKFGDKEDIYKSTRISLAYVEILLGGLVAEKILYGSFSIGVSDDLENARRYVNHYVNRYSHTSLANVLKRYNQYDRMETEKTRYKNEKIANKLLIKCYKNTYKYLKKHKDEIIKYGDLLFEKGHLLESDYEIN